MKNIFYFGYGANRSKERIKEILGKEPEVGYGAILKDYFLGYQTLLEIPPHPKKILETVWGKNFRSYTIKKGSGLVVGTVWELTASDLEILKAWEFVGIWKELITVQVTNYKGENIQAFTEKVPDSAPINWVVDSLNYENNLNPEGRKINSHDQVAEILKIRQQLQVIKAGRNY